MRKIIIMTIAAFAMASAAFAQTDAKDSIAAAKAAVKAQQKKAAEDLKAFKLKQKADLAAFIKAQKTGKAAEFEVVKPVLANAGDTLGYAYGVSQSNGLEQYATGQLGVDKSYMAKFMEGIMKSASADPADKEWGAMEAGLQIGARIIQMTKQISGDYYSADPDMSISPNIVASGIIAGLQGKADLTLDSAMAYVQHVMPIREKANKERLYGPNREAGEKFLAENKTKEGVVTTESGLQYKVITMGTGDKPTLSDKVTVDYEGRLIDGTVFDSSYKRGKSTSFGVTNVIRGWTEALQLMPVGSKWEVYVPYDLAYGEREAGKEIKPYSALIFTIELHSIDTAGTTAADAKKTDAANTKKANVSSVKKIKSTKK